MEYLHKPRAAGAVCDLLAPSPPLCVQDFVRNRLIVETLEFGPLALTFYIYN